MILTVSTFGAHQTREVLHMYSVNHWTI